MVFSIKTALIYVPTNGVEVFAFSSYSLSTIKSSGFFFFFLTKKIATYVHLLMCIKSSWASAPTVQIISK